MLRLLFGSKTESKDRLFGKKKKDDDPPGNGPAGTTGGKSKPRAKGHGRNGADAYTGAERVEVLLANCLGHARREFVHLIEVFPEPCRYVIGQLAEVYKNDAYAREQEMDPQVRLAYHREHSEQLMDDLEDWCHTQLDEHIVEPNSSLGKAINYLIRHWDALTLFLVEPGAPLDNNICERALKKAILHRKNSMFYKTMNGARVGDLFMSLIHTCQLNGVNALHYLQTLTEHAGKLAATPQQWLPWNYRDTLAKLDSS